MKKKITNTGFKGISKHKASGKFEVRVNVASNTKNHNYYVGLKPTIPEALIARQEFITNLL